MRRVAFISDTHLDEDFPKENGVDPRKNWELILKDVSSRNITEIIFGGDIGEPASNEWFFQTLKGYDLHVVLGNHDKFAETTRWFGKDRLASGREWYYSVEDDHYKSIFLDTSAELYSKAQFEWFKREIQTQKKLLVFVHHPILEVNTAVDRLYPLKDRVQLKEELLKRGGEVYIFCGHCHAMDERKEGNVTQIMAPAASFQVEKREEAIKVSAETFGYLILKMEADAIETELVILQNK